jgi:hypothetical protein
MLCDGRKYRATSPVSPSPGCVAAPAITGAISTLTASRFSNRLRHYLLDVRSLLMDADTLSCHHDLWQHEGKPATGPLERLTSEERTVFDGLSTHRWG